MKSARGVRCSAEVWDESDVAESSLTDCQLRGAGCTYTNMIDRTGRLLYRQAGLV